MIGAFYLIAPFALLCAYALVARAWFKRDAWRLRAAIGLAALPPALPAAYMAAIFALHPVYRAWALQNQVRSLHPLHYLAGYALPGALALADLVRAAGLVRAGSRPTGLRGHRWQPLALPIVWVALVPLLLYLPLNVQRRLIVGAQIPLCLLAADGLVTALALPVGRSRAVRLLCALRLKLERWLRGRSRFVRWLLQPLLTSRYSPRGLRRLLVASVILIAACTNMLLIAGTTAQVIRRAPPIYHPRAELDALDWLAANTSPQDTVLCAYETGNYVPARAGNRVVLGLGPQTLDVDRKRGEVQRFFCGTSQGADEDAWRRDLLERYGVAYVLIGPRERALGRDCDPDVAPNLIRVYDTGGYALYRVPSPAVDE